MSKICCNVGVCKTEQTSLHITGQSAMLAAPYNYEGLQENSMRIAILKARNRVPIKAVNTQITLRMVFYCSFTGCAIFYHNKTLLVLTIQSTRIRNGYNLLQQRLNCCAVIDKERQAISQFWVEGIAYALPKHCRNKQSIGACDTKVQVQQFPLGYGQDGSNYARAIQQSIPHRSVFS